MSNQATQPRRGPSELVADDSSFPRMAGLAGLFLSLFGLLTIGLTVAGQNVNISSTWAGVSLISGLASLLYHAAFEKDSFLRRPYMIVGMVFLLSGMALVLLPLFRSEAPGLLAGHAGLIVGMMFLFAFLRNEESIGLVALSRLFLGLSGGILVLTGAIGGQIKPDMLLPHFALLGLTGTILLAAFYSILGNNSILGRKASRFIFYLGWIGVAVALFRSIYPQMVFTLGWSNVRPNSFWVPAGFILTLVGGLQVLVSLLFNSENKLIILTRRELGSFFYSPIAYFVLFAFSGATWFSYSTFLEDLVPAGPMSQPAVEPIVRFYVISLFTVLVVIFSVPLLTMRLISEEKRTATLEVLLTAPVDETTVTLAKFLAGFLTYLMVWIPFITYLVALPLSGAPVFDYRPLLAFLIGLAATGAGFIAVGLFFSSLSSNQIIGAALTLAFMIAMLLPYIIRFQPAIANSPWSTVLQHISFLDVWANNLSGKLVPRQLVFPISLAVLALFGTVKVLEARKWK